MQKDKKDELLLLIQTMTKSEKRQFSIRHRGTKKAKLFKALHAAQTFSDPQLHNLRSELYKQVVNTMRVQPANQSVLGRLSTELEEARILFGKGLYPSAYRLLQQVKKTAIDFHQLAFRLQVLCMEREIADSQVITMDMETLQKENNEITESLCSLQHWSNVLMLIQGWYQRNGHVMNEAEKEYVDTLISDAVTPVGFYAILYALQAKTYRAFICADKNYTFFRKSWHEHFEKESYMKTLEPLQYEKAKEFGVSQVSMPETSIRDTAESIERFYCYGKHLFDSARYSHSLDYLSPIINLRGFYRNDLQMSAREMQIICHEKLGNDTLIDSLNESLKRFKKKRLL